MQTMTAVLFYNSLLDVSLIEIVLLLKFSVDFLFNSIEANISNNRVCCVISVYFVTTDKNKDNFLLPHTSLNNMFLTFFL